MQFILENLSKFFWPKPQSMLETSLSDSDKVVSNEEAELQAAPTIRNRLTVRMRKTQGIDSVVFLLKEVLVLD